MAALRDAIAQIDALLVRLQTDPPANGTHTPATPAASLPPVLAALSTGEQPLDASGPAATASPSPAATALAASAAPAATTATAAVRSATDTSSGPVTERPAQSSAGGATATEFVPAAPAASTAAAGKAKAATKAAKVPKAPPPEPTPADLFAKAHIQVRRGVTAANETLASFLMYTAQRPLWAIHQHCSNCTAAASHEKCIIERAAHSFDCPAAIPQNHDTPSAPVPKAQRHPACHLVPMS